MQLIGPRLAWSKGTELQGVDGTVRALDLQKNNERLIHIYNLQKHCYHFKLQKKLLDCIINPFFFALSFKLEAFYCLN